MARGFIRKNEVLEQIAVGRAGAIQVRRETKIGSDEYSAAGEVLEAIDNLAGVLTGNPKHFHDKMTPAHMQPKKWS